MKIDPSSSAHLDYGHSPEDGSGENKQDPHKKGKNYQPIIPNDERDKSCLKKLTARKARKKKKRISERRARQRDDSNDAG